MFKTKSNIYFCQNSAIDIWQSPKYTSVFRLLCKVSLDKNSELVVIYEYNGRNKFCNVRTERKDLRPTQLTFTCSNSTIEFQEKVWNKVNNKNSKTTSLTSFWCLYCKLWTYFTPLSSVFIIYFEQVNVCW